MKIYLSPALILLFLFLFSLSISAQTSGIEECGFHPTPQQIQQVENDADYQKARQDYLYNSSQRALPPLTYIPIKAHITRTNSGIGGLTVAQLNSALANMNSYYLNAGMQFYLCDGVNYINNDLYYNFNQTSEAAMHAAHGVANAINIYFCNSVTSSGGSALCGYAYFPGGPDLILMSNSCAMNGSTLPHEMGHFFSLYHTHGLTNGVITDELVNGSNCNTSGDRVCDTPADPQLGNANVNLSCVYNGTSPYTGATVDANGQAFVPDPTNIMSYSRKSCRTTFSTDQYARIYASYKTQRNYFTCSTFDVDFTANVTNSCSTPLIVNFTDNSVGATSWQWDLNGDGVIDATTQNASYAYTSAGSYDVKLTISNGSQTISETKNGYINVGSSFNTSYVEDFETFLSATNATGFTNGWTASPSNTTSTFRWNVNQGNTPSSSTGPDVDNTTGTSFGHYVHTEATGSAQGASAELISPCITLNSPNPIIEFAYHMYGAGMGELHLDINTGGFWTNDIMAPLVGQQQLSQTDPYLIRQVNLTAYSGQTVKLRFRGIRGSQYTSDMAIDDVTFNSSSSCTAPSNLNAIPQSSVSVSLNWIENGTATQWEVEYGPLGFAQSSGTTVATASNPVVIGGFIPGNSYDYYVRSDCGGGSQSAWVGPFTFTMPLCAISLGATLPFVEDFESTTNATVLDDTIVYCGNDRIWEFETNDPLGRISFGTNAPANNGGNGAMVLDRSVSGSNAVNFATITLDLSAYNGNPFMNLSFDLANFSDEPNGNDRVWVRGSNSNSWIEVYDWSTGLAPGQWYNVNGIDLDAALSSAGQLFTNTFQVRFGQEDNFPFLTDGLGIDNIIIDEVTCPQPIALNLISKASSTATVGWIEQGAAAQWEVEWGPNGFVLGTGTSSVTASNPFQISGLSPGSSYDFYVRSICGGGDSSNWSGPYNISLVYCSTGGPAFNQDTDIRRALLNGVTFGIDNPTSCPGTIGVEDFTSTDSADLGVGLTFDLDLLLSTCGGVYGSAAEAWIDWNQNFLFEPSESIGTWSGTPAVLSSTIPNASFNFTVPASATLGETRLRVVMQENSTIPLDPCASFSYGAVEDYKIVVVDYCYEPHSLLAQNVTGYSADISWNNVGTSSLWEIEYGPSGFALGTGTNKSANATQTTISGLSQLTDYQVYVRSICGPGDTSTWVGPVDFTTPCGVYGVPFLETFTSLSSPQCWSSYGGENWIFTRNWPAYGASGLTDHTGNFGSFAGVDGSGTAFNDATLETPLIDITSLMSPQLSFYVFSNNIDAPGDNADLHVEVWDGSSWTRELTYAADNPNWVEALIDLSAYSDTIKVRWIVDHTVISGFTFHNDIVIDDVLIDEAPSCPKPTNLFVSNIGLNSFDLNWVENGAATTWIIEYGAPGYTPGSGIQWVTSTKPTTISGLSQNSMYDVRVRSICGPNDTSDWSAFAAVSTPNLVIAPWMDDFDLNADGITDGFANKWTQVSTTQFKWETSTAGTPSSDTGPSGPSSGNGTYLYTEASAGSSGDEAQFVSPLIDISALDTPYVDFIYHRYGADMGDMIVEIYDDNQWKTAVTFLGQSQTSLTAPWLKYGFDLSSFNLVDSIIQVRFRAIRQAGWFSDMAIDDFRIYEKLSGLNLGSDTALGVCESLVIDAGAYFSYLWSDGSTSNSVLIDASILAPGTYTYSVTVSDTFSNVLTDSIQITIASAPNPDLGVDTILCSTGSMVLSPGIFAAYSWQDGSTMPSYTVDASSLAPGLYSYSVTVLDNYGCTASDTVAVSVPSSSAVDLGNDTSICADDVLLLDAGTGFSSYLWQDGNTSSQYAVSGTADGYGLKTYSVAVTDANGCSASDTIIVDISSPLSLDLGPDTSLCLGNMIIIDAGAGFNSYSWNNGATSQMITINTSLTGVGTFGYSVSVSDSQGCLGQDSISISVSPNPTVSLGSDTSICYSSTYILDPGAGFASYLWSNGAATPSISVSNASQNVGNQLYSVTISDINGCTSSDSVNVNLRAPLVLNTLSDTSICHDGNVLLDAGTGYSSYLWNDGSTTQTNLLNGSLSGQGSFVLSVTVTDGFGCSDSDTATVTVNPEVITNLGPDTALCSNETYLLNAGAGFASYLWSDGSTSSQFVVDASNLSTGTSAFGVTVSDNLGCTDSDSVLITVFPLASIDLGNDTSLCFESSVLLDAGAGFNSYQWNTGETTNSIQVNGSGYGAGSQNFSVTVTDANGCGGSDSVSVQIYPQVLPNLGPDIHLCFNDTTLIDAGSGYSNYVWSDGTNGQFYLAHMGTVMTGANIISVTVSDANGCAGTDSVLITVLSELTVYLGADTGICSNDFVMLDAGSGPYSYVWQDGSNLQTYVVDGSVLGTGTHDIAVTLTDSNGCSASDTIEVMVNSSPQVNLGSDTAICHDGTLTLDAGVGQGTYLWQDGSTLPTLNVDGSTLNPGFYTYSVIISGLSGCTASDSIVVEVRDTVSVSLMGPPYICANSSIILDAGSGFSSYLWNTGENTSSIQISSAGQLPGQQSYSITVTDIAGCFGSDVITINYLPEVTTNLPDTIIETTSNTVVLDAGSGFILYTWDDGSTGQTRTVNNTGTYWVQVTDSLGCIGVDTVYVDIIVGNQIDASASQIRVYPIPAKEKLTIEISSRTAGKEMHVLVRSMEGKIVWKKRLAINSGTNVEDVDIVNWASGVYLIEVSGTEVYFMERIVVN
jgi:PKD repeat protein